jgi:hypothetical protein
LNGIQEVRGSNPLSSTKPSGQLAEGLSHPTTYTKWDPDELGFRGEAVAIW